MEETSNEVTDKIRYAIKKKLRELNLYFDNDIPDYIMILIANKHSKQAVEKQLSDFFGDQTKEFTNWLWNLVSSLKVSSTKGAKISDNLSKQSTTTTLENRNEEDDVLNYDPNEEGEALCLEEADELRLLANENVTCDFKTPRGAFSAVPPMTVDISKILKKSESPMLNSSTIETVPKIDSKLIHAVKPQTLSTSQITKLQSSTIKSAKVYPIQKVQKDSSECVPHQQSIPINCELKKHNHDGPVNSVVSVKPKTSRITGVVGVNKLLLKAVSDATKSILNGQSLDDYYKLRTIKNLPSNKQDCHKEPIHETVKLETSNDHHEEKLKTSELKLDSNNPGEIVQTSIQSNSIFADVSPMGSNDHSDYEDNKNISPHFVVTLDGVALPSLKRKYSLDEPMSIDEEDSSEDISDYVGVKKQKLAERCKYWPACKKFNDCLYHHPTITCKNFPTCKFGDKCYYIHPDCKFDSLCSKKDCPFTHCNKRTFKSESKYLLTVKPKLSKIPRAELVCKYFPRCTAVSCPFLHPKLCRFGTLCRTPSCRYSHCQVPRPDQLKWKAS